MFRMSFIALAATVALSATEAAAQTHQPYGGLQTRVIKALSDKQVADFRAGRGMEMALAAELNGYPGPMHVIELADQLNLTPAQLTEITRLRDAMKAEAITLGERLIAQESRLDRQFVARTVTPASLTDATAAIARTQGELRAAHLRYHLSTIEILAPTQVQKYSQLRGYNVARPDQPNHHHAN
jgi:hypothetical protein